MKHIKKDLELFLKKVLLQLLMSFLMGLGEVQFIT